MGDVFGVPFKMPFIYLTHMWACETWGIGYFATYQRAHAPNCLL